MSLINVARLGYFLDKVKALIDNHTHSEYFPVNGGTINGDTNVNGVLRIEGNQAFYYNESTNTQTIGTNNATGGTTICCGSSANVGVNGASMRVPTILPRSNNSFLLGNTNFRWSGIYSTSAVNVSSDERMKRDITPVDGVALAKFISGLNVVSYNYTYDPEDANARIGLIAQNVQAVDPEIAKYFVTEDQNGMLGIKPADLVFPLIIAVQELSAKVEEMSQKNTETAN